MTLTEILLFSKIINGGGGGDTTGNLGIYVPEFIGKEVYEVDGVQLSKLASCPPKECANGVAVFFRRGLDETTVDGYYINEVTIIQALWRDDSYYYAEETGVGSIVVNEIPLILWINNDELAAEAGLPEAGAYGAAGPITAYNFAILYPKA